MCDMTPSFISDMLSSYVTWLIHMWHDSPICDMTHLYVWPAWYVLLTWLILRHDSFMCDMSHSCATWLIRVRHDSFMCNMTHSCATWLIHTWHALFIWDMTRACVTWLIHEWHDSSICDVTYSYSKWLIVTWHALVRSGTLDQGSFHTSAGVMSHIWMSHVTHLNKLCLTSEGVMSHSWMSHHTHLNDSSEWTMSYTWVSHVTHLSKSQHTYEWVTTQITDESPAVCTDLSRTMYSHESASCPFTTHTWICHAACLNESRHTSE